MGEKFVAIIGGGKFGLQALQWALKNRYKAIVFDSDPHAPVRKHIHAILSLDQSWTKTDFAQAPSILIIGNALELAPPILQETRPDLVIPTIPVHFLATYFIFIARKKGIAYVPDAEETTSLMRTFGSSVNVSSKPADGFLTLSYAQPGEICPPQCMGPKDYCPTFQRKKEKTITQLVIDATKRIPASFLAESEQLTKGLGGIPGHVFFSMIERFQKNFPPKFVVATTCNCHGILHAFKR